MVSIKHFITILIIQNSVYAQTDLIPCETNTDCAELKNATCLENVCKCNTHDCNENLYSIVTTIGSPCTVNAACNIDGATCDEITKKCICKKSKVAAVNNRQCLNISEGIGSECIESVQCYQTIPFSGCQQNKCICQQHSHEYNGSCYQDVALGEPCTLDANCTAIQLSKCTENRCSCKANFVAIGNRCLPIAKSINDACETSQQCHVTLGGAAECNGGFCKCKELYQLKPSTNKCVRDMLLNELCAQHSDCHDPIIQGENRLECILGECKCRSFFKEVHGYCISAGTNIVPSTFYCLTFFYLFNHFIEFIS